MSFGFVVVFFESSAGLQKRMCFEKVVSGILIKCCPGRTCLRNVCVNAVINACELPEQGLLWKRRTIRGSCCESHFRLSTYLS